MPIGSSEAQVLCHGFATDHLGGVVVPEGERIIGSWAFVANLGNFWEMVHGDFNVGASWSEEVRSPEPQVRGAEWLAFMETCAACP